MAEEKEIGMESEQPQETAPGRRGFPVKKYAIYGLLIMVVVAAAYFVTLNVVKPMVAGSNATIEKDAGSSSASKEMEKKRDNHSGHATSEDHGSTDIHMVEDIIVNPAGTGGRRFLSASIGLELSSPEATARFEQREAVIRDALITILSSQSIPELSDFKQRERLRKLIQMRVQTLLQTEEVAAVYFTEFVLQ